MLVFVHDFGRLELTLLLPDCFVTSAGRRIRVETARSARLSRLLEARLSLIDREDLVAFLFLLSLFLLESKGAVPLDLHVDLVLE